MKEGCLFVFCVYHIEISQTMTTLATLGSTGKITMSPHAWSRFRIMLQTMVEKLLNVDQFLC